MLKRIQNGYELKEDVELTKEQQERFNEIQNYPAGFMPDYEAYITDGSMPSDFDEDGNKRSLAKHPMRDLMINAQINKTVLENKRLAEENTKLEAINQRLIDKLTEKEVITETEKEKIISDTEVKEPIKEEEIIER